MCNGALSRKNFLIWKGGSSTDDRPFWLQICWLGGSRRHCITVVLEFPGTLCGSIARSLVHYLTVGKCLEFTWKRVKLLAKGKGEETWLGQALLCLGAWLSGDGGIRRYVRSFVTRLTSTLRNVNLFCSWFTRSNQTNRECESNSSL